MVMNYELRNIKTTRSRAKQPLVHIFILARQQTLPGAAQLSVVETNFVQDCASQDGIATHQDATIFVIEGDHLLPSVDPADCSQMTCRQPGRRSGLPSRQVWPADKFDRVMLKR